MIIKIPCSSATFKYLLEHYDTHPEDSGIPIIYTSKLDPLQAVLFSQVRKLKISERIEHIGDRKYFYAQLPSGFVREGKTHIGKEGIIFFEDYITGEIYKSMKMHVDKLRLQSVKKVKAIRNFYELIGLDEEDIKFETMLKQYQRYEIATK